MQSERKQNWVSIGFSSGVTMAVVWIVSMGLWSGEWSQVIPLGIGVGAFFGLFFPIAMGYFNRRAENRSSTDWDEGS